MHPAGVSSAGDFSGDDIGDDDGANAGEAYVLFGIASAPAPSAGDDDLTGTAGDEMIDLLPGDDTITGSTGMDSMAGDAGDDEFIVRAGDAEAGEVYDGLGNGVLELSGTFGNARISDCADTQDRLDLTAYNVFSGDDIAGNGFTATQICRNIVIKLGTNGTITLLNFQIANLDDGDFASDARSSDGRPGRPGGSKVSGAISA